MSDDDTDICGAECNDGSDCQHPAGACPVHATDAAAPGRPSTLDDHKDDILRGAREGMTLAGCARIAGIDESTLHRWINKYDDFRKSLKRARAQGELRHLESVNDAGSRFILERSFGYTKTEKREIEHEGDGVQVIADFSGEGDDD